MNSFFSSGTDSAQSDENSQNEEQKNGSNMKQGPV